jgi:Phage integrase, N-terminal SAM-like domain
MAAKVKWERGAWWVFTHYEGKRKKRRIGPTKSHQRDAAEIARKINAALALGTFVPDASTAKSLPCDDELRRWHRAYAPTMKPSYEAHTRRLIEQHLAPFFGAKNLGDIREEDLLRYISVKIGAGLAPSTIRNAATGCSRSRTARAGSHETLRCVWVS